MTSSTVRRGSDNSGRSGAPAGEPERLRAQSSGGEERRVRRTGGDGGEDVPVQPVLLPMRRLVVALEGVALGGAAGDVLGGQAGGARPSGGAVRVAVDRAHGGPFLGLPGPRASAALRPPPRPVVS